MKKNIMFILAIAALAANGFSQNFDWSNPAQSIMVDATVEMSQQLPIMSAPYVDPKTGALIPVIGAYSVNMIIPEVFRDETILPGYERRIIGENPVFQAVLKDSNGKISVVSLDGCKLEKIGDVFVARFVLPTNYITAYITLSGVLMPSSVNEIAEEMMIFLVGGFNHNPDQFILPSRTKTVKTSSSKSMNNRLRWDASPFIFLD